MVHRNKIGRLIYLIGASGVGKDTFLNEVKNNYPKIFVAHRYITRPCFGDGENHIALSFDEFELRKKLGFFVMDWDANTVRYGIGVEVQSWLEKGCDVFINGSRSYLPTAKFLFKDNFYPLVITAEKDIIRQRLTQRGREREEEIERRVKRAQELEKMEKNITILKNNNTIENLMLQFDSFYKDFMNEDK